MTLHRMTTYLLGAITVLLANQSWAEPSGSESTSQPTKTAIAIWPTLVRGDHTAALTQIADQKLREGATADDVVLVPAENVRGFLGARPALDDCASSSCFGEAFERLFADQILLLLVTADGTNFELSLTRFTPTQSQTWQETCQLCTLDEVGRKAMALAKKAHPTTPPPPKRVAATSSAAALARPLDLSPRKPYRVWKWVTAGVSVAAVGTGLWLVSMDGPYGCNETSGVCEGTRDTALGGWSTVAAGAGLAAVSAWMFYSDSKVSSHAATPTVGISPDSFSIGIAARY